MDVYAVEVHPWSHAYDASKGVRLGHSYEVWDTLEWGPQPAGWQAGVSQRYYDERGNVTGVYDRRYTWSYTPVFGGFTADTVAEYRTYAESYYGADGLLRVHEINRDSIDYTNGGSAGPSWGAYEEYWYDALGRRVLKRSRQQSPICTDTNRCYSSIERVVWDGDNILWEVQQADSGDVKNPTGSGLTGQTGNIGYVSAGGLDSPLGMIRNGTVVVLHSNWKGLVAFATDDAGDPTTCAPDQGSGCDLVSFPGVTWGATLIQPQATDTETWYGTVPMGFMDKTGLIYRRNRYYDPSSEQFTQPDPIGMAGGLGIYAYVGGDPVNGGDPYGLICPPQSGTCANIPGLTVTAHRGERGTKDSVDSGLGGPRCVGEELDMCALDEQACGRKGGGVVGGGGGGDRWGNLNLVIGGPVSYHPDDGRCTAAFFTLLANTGMDLALGYAYSDGLVLVSSGLLLSWEGGGVSLLTALAYGPSSAGLAESAAGRTLVIAGVGSLGREIGSAPHDVSLIPGANTINFFRNGGWGACR